MAEASMDPPTEREAQILQLIGRQVGAVTPAQLGYLMVEAGLAANRTGRRWRPQGAGRVGGGELAKLERKGWVRGDGEFGRDYRLTVAGRRAAGGCRVTARSENAPTVGETPVVERGRRG